jgi:hypothetical protein
MDEIISYKMCAVKVRNTKLRNYLKDIHELLGAGSDLKLEAANGTQIPYNGWV